LPPPDRGGVARLAPEVESGSTSGVWSKSSADVLRTMQAAFVRSTGVDSDSVHESHYSFAGRHVRLRVVGTRLADYLSRSFDHLRYSGPVSTRPVLTMDVWDGAESRVPCPVGPVANDLGPIRRVDDGTLRDSCDGRFITYERMRSLSWMDRQAGRLVEWRSAASDWLVYERSKPFRLMLRIWYGDWDVHLIHAGLLSRDGRGALLAGRSGAGKSTAALACLCAGFHYLGDDYVGLEELADGSFVGHSLYSSARLEREQVERFPLLRGGALRSDDPRDAKSLLLLSELFPGRLERAAGISLLLLPRVVDADESRVVPASAGQALFALAPSTLITALGPGRAGLERLGRLVQRVPCFWLELGRDVERIPVCVERALREVAG
jgi:hypothetical protein